MKKFLYFFSMSLFLSLFIGCEKDSPVLEPVIQAYATSTKGLSTDSILVTLNWETHNATLCYLNNSPVELKGTSEVYIYQNTNFIFKAKNDNGDETIKQVFVQGPEGPVFEAPTIQLSADPDTLPLGGGTTTITWTTQNADYVIYNNTRYESVGSLETGFISSTSDISFQVIGRGGVITSDPLEIYVLRMDDLLDGTWTYYQGDFTDTLGVFMWTFFQWENSLPCQQDDKITFTVNPNMYVRDFGIQCDGENIPNSTNTWSLNDSILTFGNYTIVIKIITLTNNVLVYTMPSCRDNGDGTWTPILSRHTYKHLP